MTFFELAFLNIRLFTVFFFYKYLHSDIFMKNVGAF